MAWTTSVTGTTITAAWANANVRDQGISPFASTAARDSAIVSPIAGQVCTLTNGTVFVYDGTGWVRMAEPLQTYTPTLNGVTATTGTLTATYHRSDGWCDVFVKFVLGASSAITGDVNFLLPIAAANSITTGMFNCGILDSGVSEYPGMSGGTSTTTVYIRAILASGTYASYVPLSSTIPMTWGASDAFFLYGRYQMVTRYS